MSDLSRMIKEAKRMADAVRELADEAVQNQDTLSVLIIDQAKILSDLIEANLKANAELFNATMAQADRDLRLELDRLYREQRGLLKKILAIPPRPL